MKGKSSVYMAVLIVLAGLIVIVSVGAYGYFSYKNTPVYFNSEKAEQAKRLYSKTMDANFDQHYPRTPDEVMDHYLTMSRLIYSDMIVENSLYGEIITQMRKLYGSEMLEGNSYESQLSTVEAGVAELKEQRIYQSGFTQLPTIFNSISPDICYIRANQSYSNGEVFYWEFQLERVPPENNWKIIRFDMTDENYEPLPVVW